MAPSVRFKRGRNPLLWPRKKWQSQKVMALAQSVGIRDPVAAIYQCVHKFRNQELKQPQSPVDVRSTAARLHIPITDAPAGCPGFLLRHPDGVFEIKVDPQMPEDRQTFTIAHEFGHLLFFRQIPEMMKESTVGHEDPEEEFLCNSAASEMLMPKLYITAELKRRLFSPKTIFDLADAYSVSRQAIMTKLVCILKARLQLPLWLVLWRLGLDGSFYPEWRVPSHPYLQLLSPTGSNALFHAYQGPNINPQKSHHHHEICVVNGKRQRIDVASWRFGKGDKVLSLLWLGASPAFSQYVDLGSLDL